MKPEKALLLEASVERLTLSTLHFLGVNGTSLN